jgi:hypothetical protein
MGDPLAWGVGGGLTTPHSIKSACYETLPKALYLDGFLGTT